MSKPLTMMASYLGLHAATGLSSTDGLLSEIEKMGITYFRFMPCRFTDVVWLFNCRGCPENIPEWLEIRDLTAMDFVGKAGSMTKIIAQEIEREAENDH